VREKNGPLGQVLRLHLSIPTDQRIRATVVFEVGLPCGFKFGDDALGEDFAEFDAPLVEGVDIPDHALGEDAHLVEGDETGKAIKELVVGQDSNGLRAVEVGIPQGQEDIKDGDVLHLIPNKSLFLFQW